MSKDKTKKRRQERRLQKKKSSLIEGVVTKQKNNVKKGSIPESVTNIASNIDDGLVYSISFAQYAEGECEVDAMVSNNDKCLGKALQLIKVIGSRSNNPGALNDLGYTTKKITNAGDYKKIYKKLKSCGVDIKDTTIYESYISNQGGRVFFWVYNLKKIIYIVAIRRNHYQ